MICLVGNTKLGLELENYILKLNFFKKMCDKMNNNFLPLGLISKGRTKEQ